MARSLLQWVVFVLLSMFWPGTAMQVHHDHDVLARGNAKSNDSATSNSSEEDALIEALFGEPAISAPAREAARDLGTSSLIEEPAESEEPERITPVEKAMGATLLGVVAFQMTLLYLVNHSDSDMRRYTYKVLNTTIAIFCAVLLFQAFNLFVEKNITEHLSPIYKFLVSFVHMTFWFLVLQFVLCYCAGITHNQCADHKCHMHHMEADLKCWATLLSHMTGFAGMDAFSILQHIAPFNRNALCSLLVTPIAAVILFLQMRAFDWIRGRIERTEGGKDQRHMLCNEEAEESELDIFALALSWLIVQSLRFFVGGTLPNSEGNEPKSALAGHTWLQVAELIVCGMVIIGCVGYGILNRAAKRSSTIELEGGDDDHTNMERLMEAFSLTWSMVFAWCVFFGCYWGVGMQPFARENIMTFALVVALILSLLCFLCIRGLDLIDDQHPSRRVKRWVKGIIASISILVGFGWERCFDNAVSAMTGGSSEPVTFRFLITLGCVGVVLPAWRMYIIPMAEQNGWHMGIVVTSKEHLEEIKEKFDRWQDQEKHKSKVRESKIADPNRARAPTVSSCSLSSD